MEFTLNNDLLKKGNDEHEKFFKVFHRCIYRKMMNEAIKMAAKILLDHGRHPTDQDFEEISNNLVKTILERKIDMLGSYLR